MPVKHTLHESIYVTVNCVLRLGANAWGWGVCVCKLGYKPCWFLRDCGIIGGEQVYHVFLAI